MSHSIISPSSAGRWVPCPGSVILEGMVPDDHNSEDALTGDTAHWLGAKIVEGVTIPVGTVSPLGLVITGEMMEYVQFYASTVLSMANSHVSVETRVEAPNVHESSYGTCDAFAFDGVTLDVWDLKYGHGLVEAFENWQLLNYAAGLLYGVARTARFIRLTIVQPRCFQAEPVRTWTLTVDEIGPYILRLRQAAARALSPNPPTGAGAWCRYCRGRSICNTLQAACGYVMDFSGHTTPRELTDNQQAAELALMQDAARMLNARIEAMEEIITAKLKGGLSLPGYSLATGTGRESWARPVEEVIALGKFLNVEMAAPVKPITPAQARKAGIPADVVAHFAATRSGVKLTRDNGNRAREIFGGSK